MLLNIACILFSCFACNIVCGVVSLCLRVVCFIDDVCCLIYSVVFLFVIWCSLCVMDVEIVFGILLWGNRLDLFWNLLRL